MQKKNDFFRKYGQMKKSSGRAWGDIKIGMKRTCRILKNLFKKIVSRFK